MTQSKTVAELAALVGGDIEGDAGLLVTGVAGLDAAGPGQLSFFGNPKYKAALEGTRASVVCVGKSAPPRGERTYLRVAEPHLAFARVARLFNPPKRHEPGVSPRAEVHATARVDASATVMANAWVGPGATVGARAVLYPGVYVGEGAQVGDDTVLSPNVAVMDGCRVGARCLLHAGAVIGADGFGFAFDAQVPEHVKIPQTGIARVEDDVEIGACSCVDRATTGETVIGHGSRVDNLVQVGHNSVVGALSILCAQVGLSGTSTLGQGVVLAGQVGVAGHLRIGDLARVGAQSGVLGDVDDGATVLGSPTLPHRDFLRSSAVFARLPELKQALHALTKRLDALEGKVP